MSQLHLLCHSVFQTLFTQHSFYQFSPSDLQLGMEVFIHGHRFIGMKNIRASPICGTLCKLFPVIFYGNMAASLLSLTMVTLNRVCMLFFPAKVKKV